MEFKKLKADSQGRVSLGSQYSNSEVSVAVVGRGDEGEIQTMSQLLLYLNREVVVQFSRDYSEYISDTFDGIRTTIDTYSDHDRSGFMLAIMSNPSEVGEDQMKDVVRQIERDLQMENYPFEKNESLTVISDEEIQKKEEKHIDDNHTQKRYVEYWIGPLDIMDLPAGYLSNAVPVAYPLFAED